MPKVVIIGAGIVGCALADELTERGWTDVTVLDQGPLFATGGSSSHAPGLVFQTNPSKTMTELARYTVEKYTELGCHRQVGGIEVATTGARWADLHRRHGWATSWGVGSRLLSPRECAELHPLLDQDRILGGYHVPTDGLTNAVLAGQTQAERAAARGARFLERHEVVDIRQENGRVTGVVTDRDTFAADVVVCCAGFWGPKVGGLVGLTVPLQPLAHQYATTRPVPALAGRTEEATAPILRHQDRDLYFREHADRIGIGSYAHRPMPVDEFATTGMPSKLAFTPEDFAPSWADAVDLLPALGESDVDDAFNGIFSFTTDGFPLIGESRDVAGFWVAEAVWVTHSAGVAKATAEWLVDGRSPTDLHECDLHRFEDVQLAPDFVTARGKQNFVEVYDIVHPLQPMAEPRPLRVSPFHVRQRELGAYFLEAAGWERPHWFESNPPGEAPKRGEWAARYWSPIAATESAATRERVALYDMTPLKRIEVDRAGVPRPLQRLTTNNLAKRVGVGHLHAAARPRGRGPQRPDRRAARRRPLPGGRQRQPRPRLAAAACAGHGVGTGHHRRHVLCRRVGAARPRPRAAVVHTGLLASGSRLLPCREGVCGARAGDRAAGVLRRRAGLGAVHERRVRAEAVGHAVGRGAAARRGRRRAGGVQQPAAGEGLPAWGVDMTTEHNPYEAGVGFAVKTGQGRLLGRDALVDLPGAPTRKLTCLTMDAPESVVLGKEPVWLDGRPAGYVTSAAFGHTIGKPIAYAWLPVLDPGTPVEVEYFGERLAATVAEEPLFDPKMTRIRR